MTRVNSAQASAAQPQSNSATKTPSHLSIRFTTAHDCETIANLFHSDRKQQLDPKGKVRARSYEELMEPISQGSAIVANDPEGVIRFFGMASDHFKYTGNAVAITEIGGIMSDVKGYRLTQVASAMLALRESIRLRESYPCLNRLGIHALVAKDNAPAQKVFGRDLAWEGVEIDTQSTPLFDAQGKYSCPKDRASRLWYSFQNSALDSARDLVSKTISRGSLQSKTGDRLPIEVDSRAYDLL